MLNADPTALLPAAAAGDQAAFGVLVEQYQRLVWAVIRNNGSYGPDAEDVFQLTFVKLYENLDKIRSPERLAGWLATVARHECHAAGRRRSRVTSFDSQEVELEADLEDLDATLVRDERQRAFVEAFESLGEQCKQLLRLLSADPRLSYDEIRDIMGYPGTGNIGPTRRRCVGQLQGHPAIQALT